MLGFSSVSEDSGKSMMVKLVEGVADTRNWVWDPSGIFLIKSFYESFFTVSGFASFFHVI